MMPTEEEVIDKVMETIRERKNLKELKRALRHKDKKLLERILDDICHLFQPNYTARISLRDSLGEEICTRGTAVSEIGIEYPIIDRDQDINVFLRTTISLKAETDKKVNILLVGLFYAGKTTIMRSIQSGYLEKTDPTTGMEIQIFDYKKLRFSVQDMGGHESYRTLWNSMLEYSQPKVICWVVDATDHATFEESLNALDKHILRLNKTKAVPIILIANKQDLPLATTPNEISEIFEASKRFQGRKWKTIGASAKDGTGLAELLSVLRTFCSLNDED